MAHTARGQLDWSVRYGAQSTYTQRVAVDTLEATADLLARHLPATGMHLARIESGSDTVMALDAEAF